MPRVATHLWIDGALQAICQRAYEEGKRSGDAEYFILLLQQLAMEDFEKPLHQRNGCYRIRKYKEVGIRKWLLPKVSKAFDEYLAQQGIAVAAKPEEAPPESAVSLIEDFPPRETIIQVTLKEVIETEALRVYLDSLFSAEGFSVTEATKIEDKVCDLRVSHSKPVSLVSERLRSALWISNVKLKHPKFFGKRVYRLEKSGV